MTPFRRGRDSRSKYLGVSSLPAATGKMCRRLCLFGGWTDIVEHAKAGDCPLGKHVKAPVGGLGDVVAAWAKRVGADRAAAIFHRMTGKDCGCEKRRERLNRLVPLK